MNAHTNKAAYIPKQLVSKQCQKLLIPTEGMMHQFTTNGGAGWFTRTGAVTRGLFELLQRDSFLVTWLTKKSLPAIDISTINLPRIQTMVKNISSDRVKVTILKGKAIGNVPTAIIAIVFQEAADEQIYLTAHTDSSFEQAVIGGLEEAAAFFGDKRDYTLPEGYESFLTSGVGRMERINLYKGAQMVRKVFLLHSGEYFTYADAKEEDFLNTDEEKVLAELSQRLSVLGEGYEPYFYEYQNKTLKDIGFTVVKCFIPQLFPMYLNEHMATIKSARLSTMDSFKYEDIVKFINTDPHPFP